MSKLRINRSNIGLLAGMLVSCIGPFAFGADKIAVAKSVIVELYPDLKGKDLHVGITDGGLLNAPGPLTDFSMSVQPSRRDSQAEGRCPESLLNVRFTFPARRSDQRIFSFNASGPAVNGDKLEQISDQINAHPDWSDSEASKVLSNAGARFGPERQKELLRNLPVSGLKLLVGDYKVETARFTIRDTAQLREHLPAAILLWEVTVTSNVENKDLIFHLGFEPFGGKLLFVRRIPPVL